MGVVIGSTVPMFLGAMIMGPAAAWLLKQFDTLTKDKIKAGFEMLVDNFSLGILGGALAVFGVWGVGPVVDWITKRAGPASTTWSPTTCCRSARSSSSRPRCCS